MHSVVLEKWKQNDKDTLLSEFVMMIETEQRILYVVIGCGNDGN